MHGLSAVESRGVGGHGDKRENGGGGEEGEQRRWGRKVWGSQRSDWKEQKKRGLAPTQYPPFSQGPLRSPGCHLAAFFLGGLPIWGPAFHTLHAGKGFISSFCFVLLPGRKWLQMPWVGHSLALLPVPRFLMIPGDRAGTSNQPQRGAEPCSGTPRTPGNPSLVLSHPRPLGARPASRDMPCSFWSPQICQAPAVCPTPLGAPGKTRF